MIPKVIQVHPVHDYVLHLRFADGVEGDVDFVHELYGEIFEPLKDPVLFSKVQIQPDFHTLCWPNGADFAPEFLYEKVCGDMTPHASTHVAETQTDYPVPTSEPSPHSPNKP